jgi:hypothetical protein
MADEQRVNGLNALVVTGAGAGGATPSTVANGSDVAEGSTTDAAYADTTGAASGTVVSLLKGLFVSLRTSVQAVTSTPSSAVASSLTPVTALSSSGILVKNAPGNFYGGSMVAGTTAGFFIAYNANAIPAAGALTAGNILAVVPVSASGFGSIGDFQIPDRFSTGVVLLFSTAANAYTIPATVAAFMRGRAA